MYFKEGFTSPFKRALIKELSGDKIDRATCGARHEAKTWLKCHGLRERKALSQGVGDCPKTVVS